MNNRIKLFSPGPTPIAQTPLKALSAPPLHHRSAEFTEILKESLELLKIFFDEEHLAVFSSTGSGGLEASIVNFLKKDDFALCLDGGKFGERWSEVLTAYGLKHETHKFSWGETPNLKEIEILLKKHQPKALYMQACETSTGTSYDIKPIASLIKTHSPKTLLIVDGVTAVGAYPLPMKENSIDVLITGSQKALGLPVGLSFLGFSEKAKMSAEKSDIPKFYFDALKELKALSKGTTVFSSPTQIWRALHAELQTLDEDSLSRKHEACLSLQKTVHDWVLKNSKTHQLELFSKNPSPSLTAILLPEHLSASSIQKDLIKKDYYIAKGQGEFSDRLLRIGHMANLTKSDMKIFLDVLAETLKEQTN